MKPIFDPEELSLLTPDEMELQKEYVKKLKAYATGTEVNGRKVDGIQIKNLNAGLSNVAKMTQSRSAMAMLKFNMLNKGDGEIHRAMIGDNTQEKK